MSISSYRFQKAYRLSGLLFVGLMLVACTKEPENPADVIYFGGDILTMASEQPVYVEALAVDDGKIRFIGSKVEADKLAGKSTQLIDLKGATLIPSIVSGVKQDLALQGATNEPNCWKDSTFNTSKDLIAALKIAQLARSKTGLGLFCLGYSPNSADISSTVTEADLDAAFPDTSVILIHANMQHVLANSVAKKKFSLDTFKTLKNAIRKAGVQSNALQVGDSADFMLLDLNPLKNPSLSLASIRITQSIVQGKAIVDAPKDLAMLAILDIFSAYADEKTAAIKMAEIDAAKVAEQIKSAKIAADIKSQAAKMKAKGSVQPNSKAATKQTAKRSNAKTQITKKTEPAQTQAVTEPSKPREVRFNMTQNGKKMTPEDFDAWMKAQGIRIVPAKPVEAVPPVDKK